MESQRTMLCVCKKRHQEKTRGSRGNLFPCMWVRKNEVDTRRRSFSASVLGPAISAGCSGVKQIWKDHQYHQHRRLVLLLLLLFLRMKRRKDCFATIQIQKTRNIEYLLEQCTFRFSQRLCRMMCIYLWDAASSLNCRGCVYVPRVYIVGISERWRRAKILLFRHLGVVASLKSAAVVAE